MADRRVTGTRKNSDRDITSLCGQWGTTSKADAIREIESSTHHYFVRDALDREADVQVFQKAGVKHLRTDPDSSCANNLDNLPGC